GKLDYLEELGINTIWLLPFYPSPLKDDGYDISDYTSILPAYGDMNDFKKFIEEAHNREIHVIIELVVNHTSDQHPWFQRARRAKIGSKWRDYYVWSETAEKYKEARIIFKDYEYSNWTWDHLAKAYYWHRFYSHQPDLNYDNLAIQKAIFKTMEFWLKLGVDGLRVDAVPYLFEREGTNCENLPETHEFLKELRFRIDRKFKNRMLLAEANQWPEDAVPYFGNGDEFNMAFHFPLMPRLFMAIRMEDCFPIVDILSQTPKIPETCQWAIFLRNHDELTLEMVTDEERDYMYRVYAIDPSAHINLGIRRRLAPLLNNDRKKIELMNALLFSLPGTPVVYYGDEIGMGDNFYLGDRNGVRTPMQWSPDRNSGFSLANTQKLYLPPIIDPEYHYEAINVANQQGNPDSLLWWMKRIIALRKRYKAFGRGSFEFLQSENYKVLTFLRHFEQENILVIANLSHSAQQIKLDLSRYTGRKLLDLFGRIEFDPIGDSKYYFTLSPYSFYWFSIETQPTESLNLRTFPAEETRIIPVMIQNKVKIFDKRNWFILEAVLLDYIRGNNWFRGKARDSWAAQILDVIPMQLKKFISYIILLEVNYTEGESETYVLPLTIVPTEQATDILNKNPNAVVANIKPRGEDKEYVIYDAMVNINFCEFILEAISQRRHFKGRDGEMVAIPKTAFRSMRKLDKISLIPSKINVEQSNTSVFYGDKLILKLFRKVEEGINPDVEIGCFLTEKTKFDNIAPVVGTLEYRYQRRKAISLAILQKYVPNEGDAWQYTLESLERYLQKALIHPTVQVPPVTRKHLLSLPKEFPELAKESIGPYLTSAQLIGQRTAEMHVALASVSDNLDFAPEPFTALYQSALYQSMRSLTVRTFQLLRERLSDLPEKTREEANQVLGLEKNIIERFQLIRRKKINAMRFRCHGDYHLEQVLYTGKDFFIIDFEGEPERSLSERRLKCSPLRDVAGIIRSFHYAVHSALLRQAMIISRPEDDVPLLQHWAQYWYTWVSVAFSSAYIDIATKQGLISDNIEQLGILLDAHILEKAIYEIGYELNNRPDWVNVPLQGILQVMETSL
ncbi:MAG: maltose alpha-D-glucosyltransferase, partial [Dehalococcoidales bacterium]|nr:maltose alpha-D-glucosyltransferase [Dehalococcoidales bacterium]